MKIQVKTEHFRESSGYSSISNCPLALAIKDQLPEHTEVSVGGFTVDVNNKTYNIDESWIIRDGLDINQMVQDANDGDEIETITVTLTQR